MILIFLPRWQESWAMQARRWPLRRTLPASASFECTQPALANRDDVGMNQLLSITPSFFVLRLAQNLELWVQTRPGRPTWCTLRLADHRLLWPVTVGVA